MWVGLHEGITSRPGLIPGGPIAEGVAQLVEQRVVYATLVPQGNAVWTT